MIKEARDAGCLEDTELADLIDGALPPEDRPPILAHLAECTLCAFAVATLEATVGHGATSERGDFALSPADPSHYVVRREIARGGMGRIVEAWDRRNQRPVAIKMLLETSEVAVARFTREARVTAKLQHPSIVTFYEGGLWGAGEPFFAMKYVAGKPLRESFAGAKTLRERLELLPNLLAVGEALAYAHGQRVVHRDLKPTNILVGDFGETVVIDWGLARELDATGEPAPAEGLEGAPALLEPRLTAAGTAIGTPCYMAPEQALGKPSDERSDVYGIGAMLYELFAGAPPHEAPTSRETLALVIAGPPAPLATRAPDMPVDLIAVVEKAMARDPADRYASANELAIELRRFLSGQLVSAHAYTFGTLLERWVSQHRGLLAMAAVLVVTLSGIGAESVRRIVQERRRADAMKVAADQARATAVTQRDAAERVVQFVIGTLRQRLEPLGRVDLLTGVAEEILSYYGTVAPDVRSLDGAAALRRGAALDTLALVAERKSDHVRSAALSQSAADAYAVALLRDRTSTDARAGLALAEMNLGRAKWFDPKREDIAALDRSIAEATTLTEAAPSDPRWRVLLGAGEVLLAMARTGAGEMDLARRPYAEGRAALAGVHAADLDDDWSVRLARALNNADSTEQAFSDPEGGAMALKDSIAIWQRLLSRQPRHAVWTHALVVALTQLGLEDERLGDADAAHDAEIAAITTLRPIVERDPENQENRRDLAVADGTLCALEDGRGQILSVAGACREALAIDAQAAADHPDEAPPKQRAVTALRGVAALERALGNQEEASRRAAAAVKIGEELLQISPKNRLYRHELAASEEALALAEQAAGRLDAALGSARVAVEVSRAQLVDDPDDAQLEQTVAEVELTLGWIEAATGDHAAARAAYLTSFERLDRLVLANEHDATMAASLIRAGLALASSVERQDPVGQRAKARAIAVSSTLERSGHLYPVLAAKVRAAQRSAPGP